MTDLSADLPTIGREFPTKDALIEYISEWQFRCRLSNKVRRNDRRRYHIDCRRPSEFNCPFHLSAFPVGKPKDNRDEWYIREYVPHTCPDAAHDGYKLANSIKLIAKQHAELLASTPKLSPKDLQAAAKARGVDLPYAQAWRTLKRVRGTEEDAGEQSVTTGEQSVTACEQSVTTAMESPRATLVAGESVTAGPDVKLGAEAAIQQPVDPRLISDLTAHAQQAVPTAEQQRYTLTFFVPAAQLSSCKMAVFAAGAGRVGNYSQCSFELPGMGQFMPEDGAKPTAGQIGRLEVGVEYRVEVLCDGQEVAREAVRKLKEVHPYEEVVYWVKKMEDF